MSILVTGGAGYIGSHTVKELLRANRDCVVIDNLHKGHTEAVKGVNLIVGDISDKGLVTSVIKEYSIDSVIHFAAESLVGESMTNPAKYYNSNVVKSIKLLDTLIENNVSRIVFSSTAAVYGEPKDIPIKEDAILNPTNVYGRTKLMIENAIRDYGMAYGLKYVILRYFNAAGAYENGEIGEDHKPESHLIPIIFQAALGQRNKIDIYGSDYNTKDGTCIRDYIHVSDLANAHILALEALEAGGKPGEFNLGTGNGYSVIEIINEVEKVVGRELPKELSQRRLGDPDVLVASSEQIKKELGWVPKYNLSGIIETAWKWHKNNPNGFALL